MIDEKRTEGMLTALANQAQYFRLSGAEGSAYWTWAALLDGVAVFIRDLLARHAEELHHRDSKVHDLQSDLDRAQQSLRLLALRKSPDDSLLICDICDSDWPIRESELHQNVTLNGITGPCPAEKEEG